MARVGVHEAKTNLSQLVKRAQEGEDTIIQRRGEPVARLTPYARPKPSLASVHGAWSGSMSLGEHLDPSPMTSQGFGSKLNPDTHALLWLLSGDSLLSARR